MHPQDSCGQSQHLRLLANQSWFKDVSHQDILKKNLESFSKLLFVFLNVQELRRCKGITVAMAHSLERTHSG